MSTQPKYTLKEIKEQGILIYLDSNEEWQKVKNELGENYYWLTNSFHGSHCYSFAEHNYSSNSTKTSPGAYDPGSEIIEFKDITFENSITGTCECPKELIKLFKKLQIV